MPAWGHQRTTAFQTNQPGELRRKGITIKNGRAAIKALCVGLRHEEAQIGALPERISASG